MSDRYDAAVLVVGAGPTGLAAANALGRYGIRTTLIESDPDLSELPKAVSIDDESMRLLQALDIDEGARPVALPGTGTHFYGRRSRLLGRIPDVPDQPFGHPLKNPIDHGAFLSFLLNGLEKRETVETLLGTGLTGLAQDDTGVTATVTSADGDTSRLRVRFVLGCDGGRSTTRRNIGVPMVGSTARDSWLAIDVVDDPHDQRYAMHHGDPRRPHVIVPGGDGRCRYEFLLGPHEEGADMATSVDFARSLLKRYRPDLSSVHIVRQQVYVFHAVVADRWRVGQVFLLGDAAHMMPPFAGQGLNSGLRDAWNLSWKLAAVERCRLHPAALDTYEVERRPNAEAMLRLSVKRGRIMMTTHRHRAITRDLVVRAARWVPKLRHRLDHMRAKPHPRYAAGLLVNPKETDPLAGLLLPQPKVLLANGRFQPLDDLLGDGYALIGVDLEEPALTGLQAALWERIGARRVELVLGERFPREEPGRTIGSVANGTLPSAFHSGRGRVVVVRPDRFILGTFAPRREREFVERWQRDAALSPELADGRGFDQTVVPSFRGTETRSTQGETR